MRSGHHEPLRLRQLPCRHQVGAQQGGDASRADERGGGVHADAAHAHLLQDAARQHPGLQDDGRRHTGRGARRLPERHLHHRPRLRGSAGAGAVHSQGHTGDHGREGRPGARAGQDTRAGTVLRQAGGDGVRCREQGVLQAVRPRIRDQDGARHQEGRQAEAQPVLRAFGARSADNRHRHEGERPGGGVEGDAASRGGSPRCGRAGQGILFLQGGVVGRQEDKGVRTQQGEV